MEPGSGRGAAANEAWVGGRCALIGAPAAGQRHSRDWKKSGVLGIERGVGSWGTWSLIAAGGGSLVRVSIGENVEISIDLKAAEGREEGRESCARAAGCGRRAADGAGGTRWWFWEECMVRWKNVLI